MRFLPSDSLRSTFTRLRRWWPSWIWRSGWLWNDSGRNRSVNYASRLSISNDFLQSMPLRVPNQAMVAELDMGATLKVVKVRCSEFPLKIFSSQLFSRPKWLHRRWILSVQTSKSAIRFVHSSGLPFLVPTPTFASNLTPFPCRKPSLALRRVCNMYTA